MDDEYPAVDIPDHRHLDLASVHESVVRLEFLGGFGTGFFFVVPGSPYEVILTAGHNLYSKAKTFTTEVKVVLPNPDPSSPKPYTIPISAEHIKVSAEYQKDPNILEADYGAILIPYTGKRPRRGFGFKLTHAFAELRGKVAVSSYRGATAPGRPVVSTGPVVAKECSEDQLSYEVTTEQGNSGSPVWIVYDSNDVAVVAIHNHRPATGCRGSRGSRLTPKVLREVFTWAGLETKKQIKAQNLSKQNPTPLPPTGLYMIFADRPFARLRRGTGTEFDVFPAQVTSTSIRHALALGDMWVMFDVENSQVVLADKPKEQSLFVMQPMRKVTDKNQHIVYIVLEDKYKLRLDGSKFKDHDLPDAQAAGVEMVTNQAPFIYFTFHPYKPLTLLATAADIDPHKSGMCSVCGSELTHKA